MTEDGKKAMDNVIRIDDESCVPRRGVGKRGNSVQIGYSPDPEARGLTVAMLA